MNLPDPKDRPGAGARSALGGAWLAAAAALLAMGCPSGNGDEADGPARTDPGAVAEATGDAATVYTWYDDRGVPHLAGRIEDVPPEARDRVVVSTLGGGDPFEGERIVADLTEADRPTYSRIDLGRLVERNPADGDALLDHRKVYVYTTPWCGFCKRAMDYLSGRGIPFEERDIEASPRYAAELRAKSRAAGIRAGGVPVLDVHGTLIVGFNRQALDAALSAAGYEGAEEGDD